nr:flavodoxin family protein [Lachnospiraceae bacterium]
MKLIITDLENLKIKVSGAHQIICPKEKGNSPLGLKHCIGCFGCWIKTPGKCVIHDGYENTGILMSQCTDLIFISKCCYGSLSPFVKAVQD